MRGVDDDYECTVNEEIALNFVCEIGNAAAEELYALAALPYQSRHNICGEGSKDHLPFTRSKHFHAAVFVTAVARVRNNSEP